MSSKLRLDWCSHEAAKYAVERWHYSKSMPAGKTVKVGVWESDKFIGVIIFSMGANRHIGHPYKLKQTEVCELTRVALNKHEAPVSQMISIAIRFLKKSNPKLRLIVSYADLDQNHTGQIYKAGNWIYEGLVNKEKMGAFIVHGKKIHPKTLYSKYGKGSQRLAWIREHLDPKAEIFVTKGKHKYLYPLDDKMKIQIGVAE